jgi:hypothetical protein
MIAVRFFSLSIGIWQLVGSVCGFTLIRCNLSFPRIESIRSDVVKLANNRNIDDTAMSHFDSSRRIFLASHLVGLFVFQAAPCAAAATATDADPKPKTKWMTGKDPIIPGQKSREKGDVSGTRKDPKFLRSLSDCKSQCENTSGSDGLARPKDECLSDCQDICCTSYQQCTFAIVNRI